MNNVIGICLALAMLVGCAPSGQFSRTPSSNVIDLSQNEQEETYELSVMDPGFETWFATAWNVGKDRTVEYYANWNNQYASAWNYKTTRPNASGFFETPVNYDPTADYGIEVERKLYYYFRWVDTKLGIPILESGSPGSI